MSGETAGVKKVLHAVYSSCSLSLTETTERGGGAGPKTTGRLVVRAMQVMCHAFRIRLSEDVPARIVIGADAIELQQNLGWERQVGAAKIRLDLLEARTAGQDGCDAKAGRGPRERHLDRIQPMATCNTDIAIRACNHALLQIHAAVAGELRQAPLLRRRGFGIFPGQQAHGERRECDHADVFLAACLIQTELEIALQE